MMKKDTIKVVYNDDYARPKLLLSREAIAWMTAHGYNGKFYNRQGDFLVPRHHPLLVACVEELGDRANGSMPKYNFKANLKIAEVEGSAYYISDYDGKETVISERDLISARAKDSLFLESFDPEKVFFTADTHFGSRSLIEFCGRPFKDAKEMDRELIRRWNQTVPEDGVVFHLGDFSHGSASRWCEILENLNGTVHLVAGNHDTDIGKKKGLVNFASVREQRLIDVGGQKIYLNHYPFLCFGGAYGNVWQLFGHVHSGPRSSSGLDHPRLKMLFPLQYDVGVDNNGYRPVSFKEVKAKIEAQVASAKSQEVASSSPLLSGTPIVFLDVDGVLITDPLSRKPGSAAARHLDWLLHESGAGLVVTGGWTAFRIDALRDGPLKEFSWSLIGATPPSPTPMESIAGWLSTAGGKHRYVILSAAPSDDTRAIHVDPAKGLTRKDVELALELLNYADK